MCQVLYQFGVDAYGTFVLNGFTADGMYVEAPPPERGLGGARIAREPGQLTL